MSTVFTVIAALLSLYLALCIFRVLLTWFSTGANPSLQQFFTVVTDPWMGIFRGIKQLTVRNLDFSPVLALIVLQVVTQVFWNLALSGRIWPGLVLYFFVEMLGSAVNFFLVFFIILATIRLIGLLIRRSTIQQFWFTLDHLLQPMVYPILATLFPRRVVPYGTGLGIFLGLMLVLALGAGWLFGELATLVLALGD